MNNRPLSPGRMLTHACYVLIVVVASFALAQVVGTVFGWILHPDTTIQADLSRNYYVAYPIRGVAALVVFLAAVYFFSRRHGYSVAFSLRETMTRMDFFIETSPALLLVEVVLYRFAWSYLPSWYLAGPLAALFGIFNPSDMYGMEFGGTSVEGLMTIDNISLLYYLWLQILIDVEIAVVVVLLMCKCRRAGERAAQEDHDKQLAEMRRDSGLDK